MPSEKSSPPPFLASFSVANGVFDIGGKLSPGSIRDQIVRTKLVINSLREGNYLREGTKVCVIGAGPAGLTAASELTKITSVETWLVDENVKPLSLLGNGFNRTISPTLYDWPSSHFRFKEYLPTPHYEEGTPALLRNRWLYQFDAARRRGLNWLGGVKGSPRIEEAIAGPPWPVEIKPRPDGAPTHFDVILLCRGFGKESGIDIKANPAKPKTEDTQPSDINSPTHSVFEPFPFWREDRYPLAGFCGLPDFGDLKAKGLVCAVAVLGGGDGAVQDMLRFLTEGRDARAILDEVQPFLSIADTTSLADIGAEIENQHRYRAFLLSPEQITDDLDKRMERLILSADRPSFRAKLKEMTRCTSVRMYFSARKLGPCYPLNRFLALLFKWFLKEEFEWDLLSPGHLVSFVECENEPCPDDHYNQIHTVFFESREGNKETRCRVVVPRLGIHPNTIVCSRNSVELYHALPYWLPDWKPPVKNS